MAYVLCKIGHNGMFAGYEGVVESMSPGANGRVSNITLTGVDRFAAQIGYNGIVRRGSPQTVMSFLQLDHTEFSNVSFEIYRLNPQPTPVGPATAALLDSYAEDLRAKLSAQAAARPNHTEG